ncbi:MAG: hypothetical protein ACLQU1_22070 [Bryobacteraceae bacterium]
MIRTELLYETYQEIAACYANLRQDGDALHALEAVPEQAAVRYWQAFLLPEKSPAESRHALEKVSSLSPNLVFPFREESIRYFSGPPQRGRVIGSLPVIWA